MGTKRCCLKNKRSICYPDPVRIQWHPIECLIFIKKELNLERPTICRLCTGFWVWWTHSFDYCDTELGLWKLYLQKTPLISSTAPDGRQEIDNTVSDTPRLKPPSDPVHQICKRCIVVYRALWWIRYFYEIFVAVLTISNVTQGKVWDQWLM